MSHYTLFAPVLYCPLEGYAGSQTRACQRQGRWREVWTRAGRAEHTHESQSIKEKKEKRGLHDRENIPANRPSRTSDKVCGQIQSLIPAIRLHFTILQIFCEMVSSVTVIFTRRELLIPALSIQFECVSASTCCTYGHCERNETQLFPASIFKARCVHQLQSCCFFFYCDHCFRYRMHKKQLKEKLQRDVVQ